MEFDRRKMLLGSAATGLAVLNPALAFAAEQRPALFIFDARFEPSRAAADALARQNVRTLDPRVRDLGIAWRDEIPALLAEGNDRIVGMTLWSDRFICESFGRDHGKVLIERPAGTDTAVSRHGLQEWELS